MEFRRKDTVWKSRKNVKSLRMRRGNNRRIRNRIHVMFVGRSRQKSSRTKSFPSLLLLCACERNIKHQTVQTDLQRVLPSSEEAQTQPIMESWGTSYIMCSSLPSRRWPSWFWSLKIRQDKWIFVLLNLDWYLPWKCLLLAVVSKCIPEGSCLKINC